MSDMYTVVGKMNATPGAIPATIGLIVAGATKRVWRLLEDARAHAEAAASL